MSKKSTVKENAEDRARIREADPVGMLISVARGMPIPRRDIDGEIVAYDQADVPVRVAAMERLLKRVLPELQSMSVDAAGAGTTFVIQSPFPLPGSKRSGATPDTIEGRASFDQLEQLRDITPPPDPAEQTATPATNVPRKRSF